MRRYGSMMSSRKTISPTYSLYPINCAATLFPRLLEECSYAQFLNHRTIHFAMPPFLLKRNNHLPTKNIGNTCINAHAARVLYTSNFLKVVRNALNASTAFEKAHINKSRTSVSSTLDHI